MTLALLDEVVLAAAQLVGLAILSATVAAAVAAGYRWATRERVPVALTLLAGLAGVALYLTLTSALGEVVDSEVDALSAALYNSIALVSGAAGAVAGHRLGDSFGGDVILDTSAAEADEDISRLVQTVGRVTVVDLPETVNDVVGYDPVSPSTKQALAGSRFVFPRNLTLTDLEERLQSRIRTDYGVGMVDLELADDGDVDHLAVGSKAAGIGPTLPPATNAVALEADPAFDASTGDIVQVWETDPMRRVLTGELRGVAGDVVTVAINSADTPKVDPTRTYRLVTLPVEDRPAREFASLLRAADESYSSVTVEAGSPLHGIPVGALTCTVVSTRPEGSEPVALPQRDYVLSPGELVFAIGTPDRLRKLELAAEPLDPSVVSGRPQRQTAGTATTAEDPVTASGSPVEPEPDQQGEADSPPTGKADGSSFDELKAEYEAGEDWDDESDDETADEEPIEHIAGEGGDTDADSTGSSENASFDELKSQFESGDADWGDEERASQVDSDTEKATFGTDDDDTDDGDGNNDLVSLDEADISFGTDDDGETDEAEGGNELGGAGLESAGAGNGEDDISALNVDDAEDASDLDSDGLFSDDSFDDDDLFETDEDPFGEDGIEDDGTTDDVDSEDAEPDEQSGNDEEESEDEEEDEDGEGSEDEDGGGSQDEEGSEDDEEGSEDDEEGSEGGGGSGADDGNSGGGTSFAQLKEEFESGDADWDDDISDSPGGDMRLDE